MQQRFRRTVPNKRRLVTTPTQAAWNSLLNYWARTNPFPGYKPEPFPGDGNPGGGPSGFLNEYRAILTTGHQYLGYSYYWGGKTPPYFDCSGFVGWCYQQNGVIPSTVYPSTSGLRAACLKVPSGSQRPGDLAFWDGGTDRTAHVAIFIGSGRILDCSGSGVAYRDLAWHGTSTFIGFYRPYHWLQYDEDGNIVW